MYCSPHSWLVSSFQLLGQKLLFLSQVGSGSEIQYVNDVMKYRFMKMSESDLLRIILNTERENWLRIKIICKLEFGKAECIRESFKFSNKSMEV